MLKKHKASLFYEKSDAFYFYISIKISTFESHKTKNAVYKVKFFKILLSTKTFILSKNALIFVFFLFLSFCFWCMQSMRKKYEVEVDVKINYTNVPIKNINIGDLPHTLSATLKEQGFYIFLYKRKELSIMLDFDNFSRNKFAYTATSDILQNALKDIVMQSTQITSITPGEISIKTVKKVGKKIPVRFGGSISFAQQYNQSDPIIITPKEVEVFGDQKILDTLQCIYTINKEYKNLNDSVNEKIKLDANGNISYAQSTVNITIPVERFTEQSVNVPVAGINIPENMTLRTFPANVSVSYFVNASKYGTTENIKVYADYDDIKGNKTGKLRLKTECKNPFIFNIRCQPAEVDFLLER